MSQHHLAEPTTMPVPQQSYDSGGHTARQRQQPSVAGRQPASPSGRGRRGGRRRAPKQAPLLGNYLGYAATFVGAGLISGAIVHHPLDPARYTVIAVIGAAVFLCATVLTEFVLSKHRPRASRVARIVAASLVLSFGIGMLSGGLQHFEDFPARGAMLIPVGLTLSFIAYVLRHEPARWRRILGPTGAVVLVTAALAFIGLRGIADGMASESSGDGQGHSHGEEVAEPEGTAPGVPTAPDPAVSSSSRSEMPAGQETAAPGHEEDGHSH
ncbi:hypothetical protein [Streptomyces longwoodensis]|uniref:hypothetical protein n=1 Tax=Streptomyces longwoodensis TaxID=68231 RepID=UPI0033E92BDE